MAELILIFLFVGYVFQVLVGIVGICIDHEAFQGKYEHLREFKTKKDIKFIFIPYPLLIIIVIYQGINQVIKIYLEAE